MSFSEQFRRNVGMIATESLEEGLALPPEEVDAVMAEPVAAEIEQEVLAPGADIEAGSGALIEAESDANTLDSTAEILSNAADGEEAVGVDDAGVKMATMAVERIATKYSMPRTVTVSKESLLPRNRKELTRSLAREAEDNANSLRERIKTAFTKFIQFIKNLVASIFDKRTKLLKRAAALQTKVVAMPTTATPGAKISLKGTGSKFGTDVVKTVAALPDFIKGLEKVKAISADNSYSDEGKNFKAVDFNPNALGGFTLKGSITDGKYTIERETADGERNDVEVPALSRNDAIKVIAGVRASLKALEEGEAALKTAIGSMNSGASKILTLATGKEDGEKVDRMKILSRLHAMSTLSSAIGGATLQTVAFALSAVEKSASQQAPAAAPEAKAKK